MLHPRRVAEIIEPTVVLEGAGVRLRRSFPTRGLDSLDPFLLFDDFSSDRSEDYRKGFPWHPHRGIETVTYVLAGAVDHRDSLGNAGRIGAGDVQWMTSGSGIMHEEMPDPSRSRLIGFQLWVNLPAALKMTAPHYQDIVASSIPQIPVTPAGAVRVIAGEASGARGPVSGIAVEPTYLDVQLAPHSSSSHPIADGSNALAYVFEGEGFFGADGEDPGVNIGETALAILTDGNRLDVRATGQGVRYLLIAGRPLNEPVARYGPFVMNTREEIEETLRDLREGTFIRGQPGSNPDTWYGSRKSRP